MVHIILGSKNTTGHRADTDTVLNKSITYSEITKSDLLLAASKKHSGRRQGAWKPE